MGLRLGMMLSEGTLFRDEDKVALGDSELEEKEGAGVEESDEEKALVIAAGL